MGQISSTMDRRARRTSVHLFQREEEDPPARIGSCFLLERTLRISSSLPCVLHVSLYFKSLQHRLTVVFVLHFATLLCAESGLVDDNLVAALTPGSQLPLRQLQIQFIVPAGLEGSGVVCNAASLWVARSRSSGSSNPQASTQGLLSHSLA